MILTVAICDHCGFADYGAGLTPYRVGSGPVLHICSSCEEKPFKRVMPHPKGLSVAEVVRLALRAER
jgi:hypothetical protein